MGAPRLVLQELLAMCWGLYACSRGRLGTIVVVAPVKEKMEMGNGSFRRRPCTEAPKRKENGREEKTTRALDECGNRGDMISVDRINVLPITSGWHLRSMPLPTEVMRGGPLALTAEWASGMQ